MSSLGLQKRGFSSNTNQTRLLYKNHDLGMHSKKQSLKIEDPADMSDDMDNIDSKSLNIATSQNQNQQVGKSDQRQNNQNIKYYINNHRPATCMQRGSNASIASRLQSDDLLQHMITGQHSTKKQKKKRNSPQRNAYTNVNGQQQQPLQSEAGNKDMAFMKSRVGRNSKTRTQVQDQFDAQVDNNGSGKMKMTQQEKQRYRKLLESQISSTKHASSFAIDNQTGTGFRQSITSSFHEKGAPTQKKASRNGGRMVQSALDHEIQDLRENRYQTQNASPAEVGIPHSFIQDDTVMPFQRMSQGGIQSSKNQGMKVKSGIPHHNGSQSSINMRTSQRRSRKNIANSRNLRFASMGSAQEQNDDSRIYMGPASTSSRNTPVQKTVQFNFHRAKSALGNRSVVNKEQVRGSQSELSNYQVDHMGEHLEQDIPRKQKKSRKLILAAQEVKKIGKKKRREVMFTNKLYKFLENEAYRQLRQNHDDDKDESHDDDAQADEENGEHEQPTSQVLINPDQVQMNQVAPTGERGAGLQVPNFHSNHIVNFTINAQAGSNFDIHQMAQNATQGQIPINSQPAQVHTSNSRDSGMSNNLRYEIRNHISNANSYKSDCDMDMFSELQNNQNQQILKEAAALQKKLSSASVTSQKIIGKMERESGREIFGAKNEIKSERRSSVQNPTSSQKSRNMQKTQQNKTNSNDMASFLDAQLDNISSDQALKQPLQEKERKKSRAPVAEQLVQEDSLASEDMEIIEALKKRLKNIRSKTSHQERQEVAPPKQETAKELNQDKINEIEIVIDQMFLKKQESASKYVSPFKPKTQVVGSEKETTQEAPNSLQLPEPKKKFKVQLKKISIDLKSSLKDDVNNDQRQKMQSLTQSNQNQELNLQQNENSDDTYALLQKDFTNITNIKMNQSIGETSTINPVREKSIDQQDFKQQKFNTSKQQSQADTQRNLESPVIFEKSEEKCILFSNETSKEADREITRISPLEIENQVQNVQIVADNVESSSSVVQNSKQSSKKKVTVVEQSEDQSYRQESSVHQIDSREPSAPSDQTVGQVSASQQAPASVMAESQGHQQQDVSDYMMIQECPNTTQMVVGDYGTPNMSNQSQNQRSPQHSQEQYINNQYSNYGHQPRVPLIDESMSNDYVDMYPVDGSLQEAPIRSTLDSKQLQGYIDNSFDSRKPSSGQEQSAYISSNPNFKSSGTEDSLSVSNELPHSHPSRLLIKQQIILDHQLSLASSHMPQTHPPDLVQKTIEEANDQKSEEFSEFDPESQSSDEENLNTKDDTHQLSIFNQAIDQVLDDKEGIKNADLKFLDDFETVEEQFETQHIEPIYHESFEMVQEEEDCHGCVKEASSKFREEYLEDFLKKSRSQYRSVNIMAVMTKKLNRCYNDLGKIETGQKSIKQLKLRKKICPAPQNFIISISDLNLEKIEDQNSKARQQRIYAQFPHDQPKKAEPILRILDHHHKRGLRDLVFLDKFMFIIDESNLMMEFRQKRSQNNIQNGLIHEQNLSKKQQFVQDRIDLDWKLYWNHAQYIDMVWKNKNNKVSVISIEDPTVLNQLTQQISLFDIKTKASRQQMYSEIDWAAIEEAMIAFSKKIALSDAEQKKQSYFAHKFGQIIKLGYNITRDIYSMTRNEVADKLLPVHIRCKKNLQNKFKETIRVLPVQHRYKVALCMEDLNAYLNECEYDKRFQPLVDSMRFRHKKEMQQKKLDTVQNKLENMGLCSSFQDYLAFHFVSKNHSTALSDLLFKQQQINLLNQMHIHDQDFLIHVLQLQLYENAKQTFVREYLRSEKSLAVKAEVKYADLPDKIEESPVKDITLTDEQYAIHRRQLYQMFHADVFEGLEMPKTARVNEGEKQAWIHRNNRRANALNVFNYSFCESIVVQKLQSKVARVKDSMSLYYKNIEILIHEDDQDYNYIARQFGYRCSLVRDIKNKLFIMEVFEPIQKKIGLGRLAKQCSHTVRDHVKKCKMDDKKAFQEDLVTKKEVEKLGFNNNQTQIMKVLMVDDFDTDDTMRGIDFNDIKSDVSQEMESDDDKNDDLMDQPKKKSEAKKVYNEKSQNAFKDLMKNRQPTPLEHYSQMKVKRDRADKKTGSQPFAAGPGQTVSVDLLATATYSESRDEDVANQPPQKFFKVHYQEDVDQMADQFKKQIGNKLKIEGIVSDAQQHVHLDNIVQVRQSHKMDKYLKKVHDNIDSQDQIDKMVLRLNQTTREENLREVKILLDNNPQIQKLDHALVDEILQNQKVQSPNTKQRELERHAGDLVELEDRIKKLKKRMSSQHKLDFVSKKKRPLKKAPKIRQGSQRSLKKVPDDYAGEDQTFRKRSVSQFKEATIKSSQVSHSINEDGPDHQYVASSESKSHSEGEDYDIYTSGTNGGGSALKDQEQTKGTDQLENRNTVKNWTTNNYGESIGVGILDSLKDQQEGFIQKQMQSGIQSMMQEQIRKLLVQVKENKKLQKYKELMNQYEDNSDFDLDNEIRQIEQIQAVRDQRDKEKQRKLEQRTKILNGICAGSKKPNEKVLQVAKKEYPTYEDHLVRKLEDRVKKTGTVNSAESTIQILNQTSLEGDSSQDQLSPRTEIFSPVKKFQDAQEQHEQQETNRIHQKMLKAVSEKNVGLMEDILKRYSQVSNSDALAYIDSHGNNLLTLAAIKGNFQMVKLLIENGYSPNTCNNEGQTPLHFAIRHNYTRTINILIHNGADETVENKEGKLPWEMAPWAGGR